MGIFFDLTVTLNTLNSLYNTKEDKVSKMAYRLRPANMMMKIRVDENTSSEDLKGPWQDLHR